MGTGAFSVLLLRLTQKRFSATQYALFSSLFALPRLLAGPDQPDSPSTPIGWSAFFLLDDGHGHPRAGDARALRSHRGARAGVHASSRRARRSR